MKNYKIAFIFSFSIIILCSIFFFKHYNTEGKGENIQLIVTKKNESYKYITTKGLNKEGAFCIGFNEPIAVVDKNNNNISWNNIQVSSKIKVYYTGGINESSPASFVSIDKLVLMD